MKVLKMMAVLAVVAFIAGCSSLQTASVADLNGRKLTLDPKINEVAHINGAMWGLYFLNFGLWTGSADKLGDSTFFKDTAKVDNTVNYVTARSQELGGKRVVDLQSVASTTMIPFPFPFLFYIKSVQASGNAVK